MSNAENRQNGSFMRCVGEERETLNICREINGAGGGELAHLTTNKLEVTADRDEIELLGRLYEEWADFRNKGEEQIKQLRLPINAGNQQQKERFTLSFRKTLNLYLIVNKGAGDSMIKNFIVKFFGWINKYVQELYGEDEQGSGSFKKMIFFGPIKQHEYLFLNFLAESGCDVLYVYAQGTPFDFAEALKSLSTEYIYKGESPLINEKPHTEAAPQNSTVAERDGRNENSGNVRISLESVRRQDRHTAKPETPNPQTPQIAQTPQTPPRTQSPRAPQTMQPSAAISAGNETELSYEALALKAGSVVMIKVYDEKGECAKSGSGVVISEKGYILTNFHVIAGGSRYGIFFENDETEHLTSDLIKCHNFNDMAILRVDKTCDCLRLYDGDNIPRGKQVVAIGSPLGLFNTVSNGIVSGFRTIGEVSMIQFTAPISHGSSGGALIDLQGRMIGLITAGYDDGQNLNLAVDYKTIGPFIRGFL